MTPLSTLPKVSFLGVGSNKIFPYKLIVIAIFCLMPFQLMKDFTEMLYFLFLSATYLFYLGMALHKSSPPLNKLKKS